MTDYKQVEEALANGVEPSLLCASCPWDRYCITPPTMTRAEVDAEIAKATAKDEETTAKRRAEGRDEGMPLGALMTTVMFAGKQNTATCCPVFVTRLRSSEGRQIVDGFKAQMRGWDDDAVSV